MAEQIWGLIADLHDGSPTGITATPDNAIQKGVKDAYESDVDWMGTVDRLVVNGDALDGADKKGRENIETNLINQAIDAATMIAKWDVKKEIILVTGTAYHVDVDGMNFEKVIKESLEKHMLLKGSSAKVTIKRKLKTTINKWFMLEGRHKIGSSGIAHGRKTSMERSKFWNVINSALNSKGRGKEAKWPDLTFFAHVHYYGFAKDAFGASMTLPCYQAIGSRFGDEACDGHIDIGCVRLTVKDTKEEGWLCEERLHPAAVVDRLEHR